MEMNREEEDIVIVGAGIAGLATSLGLHRLGLRSLVLESWENLRTTGFAFITWTNAWKAMDALGIGDSLRQQHDLLRGLMGISTISGNLTSQLSFTNTPSKMMGRHEVRCLDRIVLLEALANELPSDTIRFNSKVVSIEEDGFSKLIKLSDGSVIKTKVLIGCDGVNSVVAKWLGLQVPAFTGRATIRGRASFHEEGHGIGTTFLQLFGDGCRSGFIPLGKKTIYWFFTHTPSTFPNNKIGSDPTKMKQFVLDNLGKAPKEVKDIIEKTDPDSIISSPLRCRWPFNVLFGQTNKGNVCVAGDALHPSPPDIGQGGCAALEDGVVLARCLGEALLMAKKQEQVLPNKKEEDEYKMIEMALDKFSRQRKWRSFDLISTAYIVGVIQQGSGKVTKIIRDIFSAYLARILLKRADYDCGDLNI